MAKLTKKQKRRLKFRCWCGNKFRNQWQLDQHASMSH